ncbi:GNAT family N-acetyltransferase [Pseudolysinimonas sp.]|uniref:GNAT family N-acetyltransferase n=1 Tax=Pseudolysinimonas sp. TaxID=2680009 RepID=UPI003F7D8180
MTTIRAPRPDEWELWKQLRLRALRDTPLAFLETIERAESHDDDLWRSRVAPSEIRRSAVAIADDGTWIGQMVVMLEPPPPTLVGVYVDPRRRGDGTAERLLEVLAAEVRATGATTLRLQVGEGNDRARRFYERMGFVATGDVERIPGHPVAEHEMLLAF